MTATRTDGEKPKRPRASAGRLTAAALVAPSAPVEPAAPATGLRTKYTTMMDEQTRDALDRLGRAAKGQRRRHVDGAELLSALILLAADDAALRDQVIATLPATSRRGPKRPD